MNLHEYQAKEVFRSTASRCRRGRWRRRRTTPRPSRAIRRPGRDQGAGACRRPRQGGRREAGDDPAEARAKARRSWGWTSRAHGGEGAGGAGGGNRQRDLPRRDPRPSARPRLHGDRSGGVDIEEVAAETPERITRLHDGPAPGLLEHQALGSARPLRRPEAGPGGGQDPARALARLRERDASLAEINPLSRTPTARWSRSTPRSFSTTTRSSAIPTGSVARSGLTKRWAKSGAREGTLLREARRNMGCVVNGAGSGHGHHGSHQVLRRRAGQLPRHRRQLIAGESRQRHEDHRRRSKRRAIVFNIFGGITRCDDVAKGIVRRSANRVEGSARDPPDRHERGGRPRDPGRSACRPRTRWTRWFARIAMPRAPRGGEPVSILIDESTRLVVQGITGRDGAFHTEQMIEYGTRVVAGVTPGKGGHKFHRTSPCSTPSPRPWPRPGPNVGDLRAGRLRRRRHPGSRGRRHPLIVGITEGIPANDTAPGVRLRARPRRAPGGAQLPGRHHARGLQGGDPPGPHLPARPRRRRLAQRYADVRGGVSADGRRARAVHLPRDRRGPDDRHELHRRLRAFEADPETRAVVLIGEIGGSDEEQAAEFIRGDGETGGGVHRRSDRAARPAHGPRGRDHLGHRGDRAREDRGLRAGGNRRREEALRHREPGSVGSTRTGGGRVRASISPPRRPRARPSRPAWAGSRASSVNTRNRRRNPPRPLERRHSPAAGNAEMASATRPFAGFPAPSALGRWNSAARGIKIAPRSFRLAAHVGSPGGTCPSARSPSSSPTPWPGT